MEGTAERIRRPLHYLAVARLDVYRRSAFLENLRGGGWWFNSTRPDQFKVYLKIRKKYVDFGP